VISCSVQFYCLVVKMPFKSLSDSEFFLQSKNGAL